MSALIKAGLRVPGSVCPCSRLAAAIISAACAAEAVVTNKRWILPACNVPRRRQFFEIFPGRDIPTWKKLSALKGLSLGQSALFDALCVQIDSVAWFVEPVTKEIVLHVTLNIVLTDAE
jgi:hypothetical protein